MPRKAKPKLQPNALHFWMREASTAEQEELARRVGTSRTYLYALSKPSPNYKREARPDLAIRIEHATREMRRESKNRLPLVWRTDLAAVCRGCEFAQKCLGSKARFDIVDEESGHA